MEKPLGRWNGGTKDRNSCHFWLQLSDEIETETRRNLVQGFLIGQTPDSFWALLMASNELYLVSVECACQIRVDHTGTPMRIVELYSIETDSMKHSPTKLETVSQ